MNQSTKSTGESETAAPTRAAQSVLMVRPAAFTRNEVTRPTNRFQSAQARVDAEHTARTAVAEFDTCVGILRRSGIEVEVFDGRTTTTLPDEVFPNNWISAHPDGTAVLYPLMAWNRRQERRRDILEQLQQQARGYRIDRLIDLSHLESRNRFLEGTGSLVLDHANRLAYAGLSPRTHVEALREFARAVGYGVITFNASDRDGHAIYHTNVMMSLGEGFALVCLEAIEAIDERFRLLTRLERSGREVIEFNREQLKSFVGNMIQLRAGEESIIVMSRQARVALDDRQVESLERHGRLVSVDVGTFETYGGGSIRCMLAELLLPRKLEPASVVPGD